MRGEELAKRIKKIHIEQMNKVVLKVMWVALFLSVMQDAILCFFFKQISLSLLIFNATVMGSLISTSYLLLKKNVNPQRLGYFNVFINMLYIFFAVWNYSFLPYNLMFIAFNFLIAVIYLNGYMYFIVNIISFCEIIFFCLYFPDYRPQGDVWMTIGAILQLMFFMSIYSYALLKASQLLLNNLLFQELQTLTVAHEIRNPLTTVKGFIHLMSEKYSKQEEHMGLIINELDRVNTLVTNYLTLTKNTTLNRNVCNINKLISDLIKLYGQNIQEKGLEISASLPETIPEVFIDYNQIKQVLINLINNAEQVLNQGGKIIISTKMSSDAKEVIITVKDNGPGIEEDDLTKVFQPFYTKSSGGTGLGLAICKKIVDNHHGKISISNNLDGGISISIYLPV